MLVVVSYPARPMALQGWHKGQVPDAGDTLIGLVGGETLTVAEPRSAVRERIIAAEQRKAWTQVTTRDRSGQEHARDLNPRAVAWLMDKPFG